jgi:poly-gamma-glutamate synthesis protein (capsule biosynthesis protein)
VEILIRSLIVMSESNYFSFFPLSSLSSLFSLCTGLLICIVFCLCLLCCNKHVAPVGIAITGEERAFLEKLLQEDGFVEAHNIVLTEEAEAVITLEVLSQWRSECGIDDIPLVETYYVPYTDNIERSNATIADCLSGKEYLMPLTELAPPFTALRIDGCTVGDDDYPLIKVTTVRVNSWNADFSFPDTTKEITLIKEYLTQKILLIEKTEKPSLIFLTVGGDVMLGRGAEQRLYHEGAAGIFGDASTILANDTISVINLEGAISARGIAAKKSFTFRFSPASAQALKEASIEAVLQANNHSFDWGYDAFMDTLDSLNQAGIGVLGAGIDEAAAARPWEKECGAIKVRLFGIASFPDEQNGWSGKYMTASATKGGILHSINGGDAVLIESIKNENTAQTLNIVYFHGGLEWSVSPDNRTRQLCTAIIEAGADAIIGSHPHIVQGFEWVAGKPVFWSLGNFVFAGMEGTGGEKGLLVRLGYWGKQLIYIDLFALELHGAHTDIAHPGDSP